MDAWVLSMKDVAMRSAPGKHSPIIIRLKSGDRVRVLEEKKTWTRCKLLKIQADGSTVVEGWIRTDFLTAGEVDAGIRRFRVKRPALTTYSIGGKRFKDLHEGEKLVGTAWNNIHVATNKGITLMCFLEEVE